MSKNPLTNPTVDYDFLSVLKEKYNILDIISLNNFDSNFDHLREYLQSSKQEVYNPQDRFVVCQFDTDYVVEGIGLNLLNLFTIWREVDIPLSVMLFYTCNFGHANEIDHLCRYDHPNDRPTVIETFFNIGNYDPARCPDVVDLNEDQIKYHGLALMGNNRSHRFALYNHIKHLNDKIAITIRGLK